MDEIDHTEEMTEWVLDALADQSTDNMPESILNNLLNAAQVGMDNIKKPCLLLTSEVFGFHEANVSKWFEYSKRQCEV